MAEGNERYVQLIIDRNFSMIETFRNLYIDSLKQYYYVGRSSSGAADTSCYLKFYIFQACDEK